MNFRIELAHWPHDRDALRAVREAVFVREQGVPLALEWDDADAGATHVLARALSGEPVGTGRLLPDGHIGRMAVVKPWRGRGVGRALLERLIHIGRESSLTELVLNAQCTAIGFYTPFGFQSEGGIFDDAGIPHQRMRLCLSHDHC